MAPELILTCTDYASRAIEQLRALFSEARALRHNLVADPPPEADLHVMYRVYTELPAGM